jgi:hypothetical protein
VRRTIALVLDVSLGLPLFSTRVTAFPHCVRCLVTHGRIERAYHVMFFFADLKNVSYGSNVSSRQPNRQILPASYGKRNCEYPNTL